MSDKKDDCLYCVVRGREGERIPFQTQFHFAIEDIVPVNPGHCEVVPIEHADDFLSMTDEEVLDWFHALVKVREYVLENYGEHDGYNIGVNNGEAAGRTIHHTHTHYIPRHFGDTEDHIGGVRKVVNEKGNYKRCPEIWGFYDKRQENFFDVIDSVVSGE